MPAAYESGGPPQPRYHAATVGGRRPAGRATAAPRPARSILGAPRFVFTLEHADAADPSRTRPSVVAALVVGLRGWLAGPSLVPAGAGVAPVSRAASTLTGPATPAEDRHRDGVTAEFARLLESDAALAGELVGLGEAKVAQTSLRSPASSAGWATSSTRRTPSSLRPNYPPGPSRRWPPTATGQPPFAPRWPRPRPGFVRFDWERVGQGDGADDGRRGGVATGRVAGGVGRVCQP
jgi:hypothetical protein